MPTRLIMHRPRLAAVVAAIALPLLLTACDTTDPNTITGEVFIKGSIVADHPFGEGQVEGAEISAHSVASGGGLEPMWGWATSDANSEYFIMTRPSPHPIKLQAVRGDGFRASVLLEDGVAAGPVAGGIVYAPPMTVESTVQTDVFVRTRTQTPAVFVADAAAFVGSRTATAIAEGRTTVNHIASALIASSATEIAFARRPGGGNVSDLMLQEMREQRRRAYGNYRLAMMDATTVAERFMAADLFLEEYSGAFSALGLHRTRAAQASIAASGAAMRFSGTSNMEAAIVASHRALLMTGLNVGLAVEQEFRSAGAFFEIIEALEQARAELLGGIRVAATTQAMHAAFSNYRSAVRTQLAAQMNVAPSTIDAAFHATTTSRGSLDAALAGAANPDVVADAYVTFFTSARQSVQAQLGTNASLAIGVIPTLAAL